MNQDNAERVLKWLADNLDQGKDFVLEQSPDIAQQLILWQRVSSTGALVLALAMFLGGAWWLRKSVPLLAVDDDGAFLRALLVGIASAASCTIGLIVTCHDTPHCLKVWLAPKLFLVEYVLKLGK